MAEPMPTLTVEVGEKTYHLRLDDFTGEDELAIHREIGVGLLDLFSEVTLYGMSALLWRHRVRHGEDVTYQQVNRTLTFSALETVREDGDVGEADDPEG